MCTLKRVLFAIALDIFHKMVNRSQIQPGLFASLANLLSPDGRKHFQPPWPDGPVLMICALLVQ
jgi:hypothetical protein